MLGFALFGVAHTLHCRTVFTFANWSWLGCGEYGDAVVMLSRMRLVLREVCVRRVWLAGRAAMGPVVQPAVWLLQNMKPPLSK